MKRIVIMISLALMLLTSCRENYSNGERIGTITRFSEKGLIYKSWEINLNVTQTGMNSSGEPFECSMDNNKELNKELISLIDSAANLGWKVKIIYHECTGKNITRSRGETNYFIDDVIVLDKNFTDNLKFNNDGGSKTNATGHVIDTIYVVIVDKSRLKK